MVDRDGDPSAHIPGLLLHELHRSNESLQVDRLSSIPRCGNLDDPIDAAAGHLHADASARE